jgi:hypothetical protein
VEATFRHEEGLGEKEGEISGLGSHVPSSRKKSQDKERGRGGKERKKELQEEEQQGENLVYSKRLFV